MGKKKSYQQQSHGNSHGHGRGQQDREIRRDADIAKEMNDDEEVSSTVFQFAQSSLNTPTRANKLASHSFADGDEGESSDDGESEKGHRPVCNSKVYMWEFGQNDPKRDSGSKLVRLGYANVLKLGSTFPGVVLSSEATSFVSPEDRELIEKYGVSGINCSWNRLEEIPFNTMGKSRNHRTLPLLVAANTVNYGKPYKMNTAEATAACLYIAGFKADAEALISSFSYGPEFLRLNYELLERYSSCLNEGEVKLVQNEYIAHCNAVKLAKEQQKQFERIQHEQGSSTSYLNEDDLPPRRSDDEEDYYYEYDDCEK